MLKHQWDLLTLARFVLFSWYLLECNGVEPGHHHLPIFHFHSLLCHNVRPASSLSLISVLILMSSALMDVQIGLGV